MTEIFTRGRDNHGSFGLDVFDPMRAKRPRTNSVPTPRRWSVTTALLRGRPDEATS